jgi:uncharacterized Zn finger protein (UPF0148 family)
MIEDISCPVCGYYCLGRGGIFCIDKPSMIEDYHNMKKDKAKKKIRKLKDKIKELRKSVNFWRKESATHEVEARKLRRGY